MPKTILSCLLALSAAAAAFADDDGAAFFEKKIRPVLVEQCYRCHSAEKRQRGGLALDTKESLRRGGDSGPGLVPGDPAKSWLIKAIRYDHPDVQMPPDGKLPAAVIADFEQWVKMGAPDPRAGGQAVAQGYGIDVEKGRQFWAFRPAKKHDLPELKNPQWAYGPVDHFVLAKLEEKNVRPVGDAGPEELLRRLSFALTGLPPTPAELDAYRRAAARDPKAAFVAAVDRLLASPRFGERWGRHWLDVARYAESSGGGRSLLFPEAWRYRDYVIRAFNSDMPYNQFLREQVAGDLLEAKTDEERYWRLIATAFLILGPINYEQQDKPLLEADVIDEQLDTIGRTMLGMTIGCARCHDHKFDPIPTKDYYALAGIFKSTQSLIHDNVSNWVEQPLPMSPAQQAEYKKHQAEIAALQGEIQSVKAKLSQAGVPLALGPLALAGLPGIVIDDTQAKQVGTWSKSTFMNTFVGDGYLYSGRGDNTLTFTPRIERDGTYEVRLAYLPHTNRATNTPVRILSTDGETDLRIDQKKAPPVDGRWVSLGRHRFEKGDQWYVMVMTKDANGSVVADAVQFIHEDDLEENRPAPRKEVAAEDLQGQLKDLELRLKRAQAGAPKRPMAMSVKEAAQVDDFYVCIRGNIHNKGPEVPRGFLQVATVGPMPTIPAGQSGRRQLADWLASEQNPLTARVMVNRIWHHLFGCGIVKTVDNFGSTGSLPSHPELLDYLAVRFVEEGWSVKKLIREIVLSHTYQLSSHTDEGDPNVRAAIEADVDNRLLWRQNRRRLEAEAIRDAILTVSGTLDLTAGGPSFPGTPTERDYQFTDTRRSVYTPVFRNRLLELFEVFDFPDPNMVKGARAASTVAPQALYLMNSPFVMDQARAAAEKLLSQEGTDAERLDRAYRAALGRLPTERERELALPFVEQAGESGRREAWEQVYQVLFSCIDFRYVN